MKTCYSHMIMKLVSKLFLGLCSPFGHHTLQPQCYPDGKSTNATSAVSEARQAIPAQVDLVSSTSLVGVILKLHSFLLVPHGPLNCNYRII